MQDLISLLKSHGQEQLLRFWGDLTESEQGNLEKQIRNLDFEQIDRLVDEYVLQEPEIKLPDELYPAPYFPLEPAEHEKELYANAVKIGKELISRNKVAALTVAGGQGTRLGYDGPKGTFPITPVKHKSLFQYFAESIARYNEKYNCHIQWYIMTSELNDAPTREFFSENNFFGLDPAEIMFFVQGTMPAIDYQGKLLMKSKSSMALAPDGHGGTLMALHRSGALDRMKSSGAKYISYFQVDNPLVSIVDPLFIGLHHIEGAEMSARMLAKTGPFEKLGNFCISDSKLQIIEYSDMPEDLAKATNADGSLKFIAGSPAIHIINREFVERLTEFGRLKLPWHRADKKVPHLDAQGQFVEPQKSNAVKLETFIFDALPLANKTMILEARREEEFSPTKNAAGVDSVVSSKQMLVERDAARLEQAGIEIPRKSDGTPECIVEISPRIIVDDHDAVEYVKNHVMPSPAPGTEVYVE